MWTSRAIYSLFFILLLAIALPVSSAGSTLYVSPSGSDGNPCSPNLPCREIRRALELVVAGDTILVADGSYQGFDVRDLRGDAGRPITIKAQGTNAVIQKTTDRPDNRDTVFITFSSYIVVDGLRSFNANRAALRVDQSPKVVIRNCVFGNNAKWGIFTDFSDDLLIENNETYGSVAEHGIYVSNSGDRPIVRGNRSHDNRAAGIHMNADVNSGGDGIIIGALIENNIVYNNGTGGGAGINMDGVQDSVVRNNVLYNNHATGIALFQIDGAEGPKGNKVYHNTVHQASDGRWALLIWRAWGNNTLRNNVLYHPNPARGGVNFLSDADVVATDSDYNVLDRITPDDAGTVYTLAQWKLQGHETHSLSTPTSLFVNAAGGDFHLAASSPAIDRGLTLPEVSKDRDGNQRPLGAASDIGAYEAGGVPSPGRSVDENRKEPSAPRLTLGLQDQAAAVTEVRYVRAGATGSNDGSNWTNAYPQLPATLLRGAIYYVADGTYPGYTFDDADSGTELIQIKKATVSDHGTGVGWQNAYGDGRAQFGTLVFSRSYYVLDGQVGGGPSSWKSGFGFYIFTHGKGIESRTDGVSHVTIRHVEIEGHGDDGNSASNDLIYLINAHSHWLFSHLYLHDAGRTHFLWRATTDSIIEYSYMARNESTPEQHSEAISAFGGTDRNIARYSVWEDCEGTGVIMVAGSGWDIYGNVIFWTGNPRFSGTGNGSIGGWSGHLLSNTRIHNNTVVNGTGISSGIRIFSSGGQNTAFNNLFYNCENFNAGRSGFAGLTASHSLIATSSGTYPPAGAQDQIMTLNPSLFVDPSKHDYRLARATLAGSSLAPPFERDLLGRARGADGVWDRGAYELGTGNLPTVSIRAEDALASEPGADAGTFVISRSGSTAALTVNLSVGGTATPGQDYTALPASVTIPAGSGSASLTLSPRDDSLAEGNETVVLTVLAAAGYQVGSTSSATVSINDNDVVVGTGLSAAYYDNMDFTAPKLSRTDATVNFNWRNGSPDPSMGIDTFSVRWMGQVQPQFTESYTFYTRSDDGVRLWVNGQLLIDKWVNQAPVEWSGTVALVAGQRYELKLEYLENVGGALVELRWSSPSTPKQILPTSALFPPGPSLPAVSIAATDANASEPGSDKGIFTLTRTGSTSAPLTVNVSWGGTATGGSDYALQPTALTFPAGAASVPASVVPTNDALVEGTETVVLTVLKGTGYTIGSPASAMVSIADDDVLMGTGLSGVYYDNMDFTMPKLTRTDATVNFTWGSGSPHPSMGIDTFSVRWTGQVQPQFSQSYTFYTRSDDGVRLWVGGQPLIDKWVNQGPTEWSGTIALVAGQKYGLKLEFLENVGEALVELRWSSPSTPKQIIPTSALFPAGSPGPSLPVVSVAATDATASEPGSDTGSFALTRTGSTSAPLTVNLSWGGTATGGSDYSAPPTTLTFPASAASLSVSVVPTDDTLVEGTETVVLAVLAGTGYEVGPPSSATVTLADNDAPLTPTRYVRAGATGTAVGTDWTNAYPQLPAILQRGVTYYLADGTYPGYTFDDAESGAQFITVKKATGSDHGTGVGWQPAYGDGQAELGAVTFARSYYVIDGQVGGGPQQWTTGHGIRLRATGANQKVVRVGAGTTPSEAVRHIRLAHVEIVHRGRNTETSDDGIYGFHASHITLSQCYLHDFGRAPILMREWNDVTVEYSYIARNSSSPAVHSEGVSDSGSDNVTFRHVVWKDIEGTAIISTMERGSSAENWTIYGNVVFYSSQYGVAPNNEGIAGWIEVLNDASNGAVANNWKIYNNTLVNVPGLWSGIRIDAGTGNVARNNLWYNSVRTAHHRIDISHSWYFNTVQDGDVNNAQLGAGNPFVNLAGEDFHLAVPTLPGVSLGAPYDVDPDGIKRGADGNWDRGAFELPR